MTGADVERLAKRRWYEREATFPKFTRLSWEDSSPPARTLAMAAAEEELITECAAIAHRSTSVAAHKLNENNAVGKPCARRGGL